MKEVTYKHIEGLLYNYKTIKAAINHNRIKLETLDIEDGLSSITHNEPTSKTNKISSLTENTALRRIEIKEDLKRKIEIESNKLRLIDNALEGLTEVERDIITLFYIEGKQWEIVAFETNYSAGWCKERRKQAINKMLSYW